MKYFHKQELELIEDCEKIAHELVHNYFKLSNSYWQKHIYEIVTLRNLEDIEITNRALAQILKYNRPLYTKKSANQLDTIFRICIQDHIIIDTVDINKEITLRSLLLYIIIHELVHLVRFGNFMELFETPAAKREKEEKTVHEISLDIISRFDPDIAQKLQKCYLPVC